MKLILLSVLLITIPGLSAMGQDRNPDKIKSCVDVSTTLYSKVNDRPIVNGWVSILDTRQIDLFARVSEMWSDGQRKRSVEGWRILDERGNEVPSKQFERRRALRGLTYIQKIVFTVGTNPDGCFVVERRNA